MSDISLTFLMVANGPSEGPDRLRAGGRISKSLAKKAVAIALDGKLRIWPTSIEADANVKIIVRTDPEALELIRHDAAHVMAEAVQSLWPGTQVTIGPVIENGFYYDFAKQEPFHPDDLAKIEAKMHEIIKRDAPFTKEFWSRDKAKKYFRDKGEMFKVELVDTIPPGEDLKIYKQGDWLDLCRGPHMTSTGQVGKAFKLTKFAGSYWRGDHTKPQLQRVYGTAWASEQELAAYLKMQEEAEKRDHRGSAARWTCSTSGGGAGRGVRHPGWGCSGADQLHPATAERGRLSRGERTAILDKSLWVASGHWATFRENIFTTITEDDREFAIKPMNCPGHVQIFKHGLRSYELPYRVAEFGIVHR